MGSILAKKATEIEDLVPSTVKSSDTEIKLPKLCVDQNRLDNPGTYQELHKKCKDIMPVCFDGIRILFNNNITQHFQTAHLLNISSGQLPSLGGTDVAGYKFSTCYVGSHLPFKDVIPPTEMYPVLYGDIDMSGNMNANIIHHPYSWLRYRYVCQFNQAQKMASGQLTSDIIGKYFTASLTVLNLNAKMQPEIIVGQYLYSLARNVAVGFEVCYNNSIPKMKMFANQTLLSAAFRIQQGTMQWTGALGTSGLQLCVHQQASENLQIAAETNINFVNKEAMAQLGYQVELSKQSIFRGMLDSNGNVSAVLEKRLQPMPITFSLSANLNYCKQNVRLGFGVIIK